MTRPVGRPTLALWLSRCGKTHQRSDVPADEFLNDSIAERTLPKSGVRYIRVHDTRRSCASLLVALDVHLRVAMQRGQLQDRNWPLTCVELRRFEPLTPSMRTTGTPVAKGRWVSSRSGGDLPRPIVGEGVAVPQCCTPVPSSRGLTCARTLTTRQS